MNNNIPHEGPDYRRAARPIVRGQSGMVSAGHYLAASSGHEMLRKGGNAIDAGVAAGLAINVVHHDMTSFGGVAPIIIYSKSTDAVHTISGLGRWPKAANQEYFDENHDGTIPRGIERSVVPAAPDAWITALRRHGSLTFGEVAEPAIRFAREGYPVFEFQRETIHKAHKNYDLHPTTTDIFLPNGEVPDVGDVIVQEALANTLEGMVEAEAEDDGRKKGLKAARNYFYEGTVAEKLEEFSRNNGGLICASDLSEFSVQTEDPVHINYNGYDVYTCGPWCQGPVFAQALKILEHFDLERMGHNSAEFLHTILEALMLAFADREWYYGDPDFVDVPMDELVSDSYAKERAQEIKPDQAHSKLPQPGETTSGKPEIYDIEHLKAEPTDTGSPIRQDTSYVAAMDKEGNIFSATPSDSWRHTPIVPEVGIPISGRGSQSRLNPRHPASLEPWKRPRLTPNPAVVLKDGEPFMAIGTPGGDVQPQAMLQVFLNQVEFNMNPQEAIEAPRVATYNHPASFSPHQYFPGVSAGEERINEEVFDNLKNKGHRMYNWPQFVYRAGAVNVVQRDTRTGVLQAGADLRRENYAIGE
jgi:gamma-glutamyltranspeptidase/glutathione hydrolase